MGYVADRWHKSRPAKGEPECGEHKGKVASAAHGKGKRWQARYDDPNGQERTALFRTQAEAEREVIKQENAKLQGSWLDPEAGKVTVSKFALETWLPAQGIIDRTQTEYRGILERYLIPEWGQRQIRSIKPSEAGAWQQLLASKYGLSGSTPNRVARYVRGVFRLAVVDRVIAVSPFDGVKAPTLVESTVDPPDLTEVKQIVAAAYKDIWRVMFALAAQTGLRSGELRGLDIRNVDFLRKAVRVEQQLVYEAGRGLYLDKLKTGAGRRQIPVQQGTVDMLASYVEAHPPTADGEWAGLIFMMPGGKPVGESTLDWALKNTCAKAALESRHLHELRHHYASVLIAGGENPRVVQKRLGHKDVLTTLRTYTHLWAEAEERTREILEAAWNDGGSVVKSGTIPESRSSENALAQVRPISG